MKKIILFIILILTCIFNVKAQFAPDYSVSKAVISPLEVKAFDLNGDGNLDVLTASNFGAELTWSENLGNGSFSVQKVIADRDVTLSVYAADLDGDGDLDVIAGLDQVGFVWYENAGNGTFGTEQLIGTNYATMSVHANDLDSDGDMDVIGVSYTNGKVVWYENLGGGVFGGEQIITAVAAQATSVHTADIDNDGDIDVLSSSQADNKIAWYENLGGGVFGSQQIISTNANGAQSVYTADINVDGKLDVLSASFSDNKVAWYMNMGNGTFSGQSIISTNCNGASSVFSVDMDGDGDDDVLASSRGSAAVYWYENLGGNFNAPQTVLSGADYASSVFAADMDNDGDNDVITAATDAHKIALSLNQGTGSFSAPLFLTTFVRNVNKHVSADIDSDGYDDVVVVYGGNLTSGKLVWYKNLGNGKFGEQQEILGTFAWLRSVHANDLDGDGDIDIVCATYLGNKISWFENLGGGSFGSEQIITTDGINPTTVYSADMDNDGDIDIVSGSYTDDKVGWCENLGGGVFGPLQTITTLADGVIKVYVEDIDGDGDKDVFSVSNNDKKIAWYENLGGGSFGTQQIVVASTFDVYSVHVADIDGDGDMDVLPGSNTLLWYENLNGTFSLNQLVIISNTYRACYVHATDMDGDGDNDIVYSSTNPLNPNVSWVENLGGGSFGSQQIINTKFYGVRDISTFDMDNDGSQDVLLSSPDDITIFENFLNSPYQLSGDVFYDANQNSNYDVGELGLNFIPVTLSSSSAVSFSLSGAYSFYTNVGSYTVSYSPNSSWGLTTDSLTYNRTLTTLNPTVNNLDFGFYPDTIYTNINPVLTGGNTRCDEIINYWINIRNIGTTTPNGIIHLQLDDSISFVSADVAPDSINGQNIYWSYNNLFFFTEEVINLQVQMPSFISMGDTLSSNLVVHELNGSNNVIYTNSDSLNQILVCAYDPNDKSVNPEGVGYQGYIPQTQELEYLIRFQNTGNATANNVLIRDQLDENLNWTTLNPIASSDSVKISIDQYGEIEFYFENIMLPDSNVDFLGSQGFVKFSIQPDTGLAPLTQIYNTANIYFDYNPAVITNTVLNTIECYSAPQPVVSYNFPYLESGVTGNYTYQWYLNDTLIVGATNDTLMPLVDGNYTVQITDSNGCYKISTPYNHISVGIEETQQLHTVVFPNPFNESTTILFNKNFNGEYDLLVYNIIGAEAKRINKIIGNKITINKKDISKGMFLAYLIHNQTGKRVFVEKLIVQ